MKAGDLGEELNFSAVPGHIYELPGEVSQSVSHCLCMAAFPFRQPAIASSGTWRKVLLQLVLENIAWCVQAAALGETVICHLVEIGRNPTPKLTQSDRTGALCNHTGFSLLGLCVCSCPGPASLDNWYVDILPCSRLRINS